jgi:hypothetical protein
VLQPLGVGPAFALAVASALGVSAIGLRRLRASGPAAAGPLDVESA